MMDSESDHPPSGNTQASNFCRRRRSWASVVTATGSMPNCRKQSAITEWVTSLKPTNAARAAALRVLAEGVSVVAKALSMSGKTPLSIVIVRPTGRSAKFQRANPRREKVHYQKCGRGRKDITRKKPHQIRGFSQSRKGRRRLVVPAAEQQRAVRSAKTERIRHGVFEAGFSGLVGHQVHPGSVRVGIFEIDRRRQHLIAQRKNGNPCFETSSAAQQVSGHRFGRTHRKLVIAEEIPDGVSVDCVANRG